MPDPVDEPQAAQTPKEDLCRIALEHYEKVSGAAHEWYSSIPKAIKQYYETDPDHQRLQLAVLEAMKEERRLERLAEEGNNTLVRTESLTKFIRAALATRSAVDTLIEFEAEHKIGEK